MTITSATPAKVGDMVLVTGKVTTNKDFGSGSVLIAGNFSNSSGTMVPGTSTITFTGAGKSVSGSSAKNFYNLVINSGASVAHTNGGAITISADFTNNGALARAPPTV